MWDSNPPQLGQVAIALSKITQRLRIPYVTGLVLALSIPLTMPGRDNIIALVFGAVLFSLVVQALSLPWLIRRLKLSRVSDVMQQVVPFQV